MREVDEAGVRLRDLPERFTYAYDLGDGWEHDVKVLGPGGDRARLVSGEGNCPPEDCGGPPGYEELLVKLTPGGRLPRALVRQVQQHRPEWNPWGKPASVEEDLLPLLALDDLLCQVGVLRVTKGVIKPIRAVTGPDCDVELVRRLRAWLPDETFTGLVVGNTCALLAVEGPTPLRGLAADLHEQLGHGWATASGAPVQVADVEAALRHVRHEIAGLDLVRAEQQAGPQGRGEVWAAGPSATSLLPRATALADLWETGVAR